MLELENITGINTYLGEGSYKNCFHSKGHQPDFNSSTVSSQSHFDTSTDDLTHKTPEKKWKSKKRESANLNSSMFARYGVLYGNLIRMKKVTHSG